MWKLFLTSFLSSFVNETLTAKVGQTIFKDKGTITKTGPDGTTLNLKLGGTTEYEITVKKIKLKYEL